MSDKNTLRIRHIVKRDGRKETFNPNKISKAVQAAMIASQIHDDSLVEDTTKLTLAKLDDFDEDDLPTVEDLQDLIENTLMELNQFEVAKSYILYRQDRNHVRDAKSRLMQTYQGITFQEAEKNDLKRDNANIDGDTAMGTMLKFGAEGSKEFAKSFTMKPEHVKAHDNGDIHIHDLDFLPMGTLTCCQIDVLDLFKRGFSTGHGYIREPQSIGSYAALAAIILQANQNDQHGGQSIPHFDYAMAPGVKKTFYKEVISNLDKLLKYQGVEKSSKEKLKKHIGEINYPNANKSQLAGILEELNETFKTKLTLDQVKQAIKEAAADTEKLVFQAMEGFIHNLNTMHSRAGAQVPFTSINFGTDTTPEGRIVTKAVLEATWNGLGKGETPIFPISIFKVKEGVNYHPKDPNYDLFKQAIKVSAKRLFPNFVFVDAPFNLQYYKPGDYRSEVASMGCRTRVFSSIFPESDGRITSRGNISFTTINLPAIAIRKGIAKGKRQKADMDGFYKELDKKLETAANQLLERFEIQANKKIKNFPFLMGQGVWMDSEKLGENDTLREAMKHGTLSIGFIGLAESLTALTGKHHGESKAAQKLGVEIITYMRKRIDELAQKHQLNFSLLATPAEGIAGRFTQIDAKRYGKITGVTDKKYYTNSYHVPVKYKISAFDKITTEAPYHALCNAGHITYVELDGDPLKNLDAFESIIRHMRDSDCGYGSINHPVDRDPVCDFSGIIDGDICPKCGRKDGDDGVKFERLRRITGYLVGSLDRWNDAKKSEESERVKHA
ncbi:MAG: anaerobic ribonucleoside triphosphate reductase [Pseudomonadales bacterium]|jgi:ribonucleoside-triphosphate reductase|nr:anaerobic ribonucleoside triphosphate reductase [Pseudomonadales bacterium]